MRRRRFPTEKLFYDVKRQMVAVSELVEVDSLLALLGEVPTAAEVAMMREDCQAWSDRWWKAPSSGRRWASEGEDARTRQPYVTHRVLEQTRKQKHQAPTATQRP